ncbi:benzoate/H(+) symporter BenE family transporter [Corynebacterium flavescens]|uniref:benzoate/H(+) symporter BenE family transporter n=1 Tax=Corynebacterium flavescens TaxID=28028 RepID=UPI003FD5C9C6
MINSVSAGIITALVGFTSSFVVVLTGLRAVGASEIQASSGLVALCIVVGASTLWLALRHRIPATTAWSTPGAALLTTAGASAMGFDEAIGAFILCAALLLLSGLWPALGKLTATIPTPVAQAMLAGVLFPLCLKSISGLSESPAAVAPVVVIWLLSIVFLPMWAVPLAFVGAGIVIAVHLSRSGFSIDAAELLPTLEWTSPAFSVQAAIGIALPLYVVTMAAQNLPGVAVLRSYDYEPPWRDCLSSTALGSLTAAPFGASTINLAAISAALAAAPETNVPADKRWRNAVVSGLTYLLLAGAAAAVVALAGAAPTGLIAAVAGLALLGAFGGAVQGAWSDAALRLPAVLTFLVAASGITVAGIGSAFWALVTGVIMTMAANYSARVQSRRLRHGR